MPEGPPTPCAESAAPLTPAEVAGALRKHGFSNVAISRDCSTMAEPIMNADVDSDGILYCTVYAPRTSWGHKIRTEGPAFHSGAMWHGINASAFLENMECQLYPEEGHEEQQMAQLLGALRDLKARAA